MLVSCAAYLRCILVAAVTNELGIPTVFIAEHIDKAERVVTGNLSALFMSKLLQSCEASVRMLEIALIPSHRYGTCEFSRMAPLLQSMARRSGFPYRPLCRS